MAGIASSVPLIARPSFDRACSFVPSEYVQAWEWFLREEQRGEIWENLPHNITSESPQYPYRMTIDSEPFCVSRDAGIYWPGRGRIKHPAERTFALSVHSSTSGGYSDVPPLYLDDGTWIFKYSSHRTSAKGKPNQNYNQKMIDCMEYGVPVGVFFATSAGYRVLGLAFVERYESENSWFVLHGPRAQGRTRRTLLSRYELYEGCSCPGGVLWHRRRRRGQRSLCAASRADRPAAFSQSAL